MATVDIWMVLLFPFLDSLPFSLPRYWLFRDKLRIPFRYVALLQLGLSAAYSALFYYVNLGGYEAAARWTTIIRYSFLLIFLILAFLLIKEHFPQQIFTWLLTLAWTFFVMGNANYIESRYFWDFSDRHPYLVYNIARVGIYLVTCPFLFRFLYHTVADSLRIKDRVMWRRLWIIPLFSTLFGMLYCTVSDVYAYASWQFLISRWLMLLGACYVSYVALKMLEVSRSRTQLEEALKYAGQNLLAQKKQFDGITSHMDEMKKARHDLRQHLAAVRSYIERDDKAGLAEYIDQYQSRLPLDVMEFFCGDEVVNAVIGYYAALAREAGVRFLADASCPAGLPVSGTDITVLLGNLLENAVEACRREPGGDKVIKLRVKRRGRSVLLILLDNTCTVPVAFDGDTPLSSKREGPGIGAASVREIAGRYSGSARFEQRDGMFYASVRLKLPQPPALKEQKRGGSGVGF